MSSTTTKTDILQREADKAQPGTLADVFRLMKIGHMFSNIKVVVTGLAAASAIDITSAAVKAAATITGITLDTGENLPPIRSVITLRVTAVGGGATGPRVVTDAGGTAAAPGATGNTGVPGVALLSDDGKTLTFEGTVTGFILEYTARSFTDTQSTFVDQG